MTTTPQETLDTIDGVTREELDKSHISQESAREMLALLKDLIHIEGPQPGDRDWADRVFSCISRVETPQ